VASEDRPRVWVNFFDERGGGHDSGRAFLAPADASDLPPVPPDELSLPRYRPGFGLRYVELREGMVLRLMDEGEDARGRPFRSEADGIVHFDADRGWYAEYDASAMDLVLWNEPMT
jgi:hypothetical protein